jgi:hypothetical protein
VAILKSVSEVALRNRDRIPDPPIGVSYALLGLSAEQYRADEITDAMSRVIAAWQDGNGAFYTPPPIRPPLESNDVTATALSLRALQLSGRGQDDRIARAGSRCERRSLARPRSTRCRCSAWPG